MERTFQETDEIIKDIKAKVNLLTSIDKRFLIKYIKQTIRDEPKETIEKNEELHRNNLVKFNF
jgi:ribosomal protein S15P/S13E